MTREPTEIDPRHRETQRLLRSASPVDAGIGAVLTAVGMINFFSSIGSFEPPRFFWCAFVGLPLLSLGIGMSKVAYLGAIARYLSSEVAPVQKDTFNYLSKEAGPGVERLARAVGQGLAQGRNEGPDVREMTCPRCQSLNPSTAFYCSQCGSACREKSCVGCGGANSPDAKFCNQCGIRVS